MEPLISVIVPVYNVEAYLPKCLDSIVSQTYQNLEIILVDDGSKDHCGMICDQYAAGDSRIKVIHQANQGVSAARNVGLDMMNGEYVMFVDSDDWLDTDAIQILYERMKQDGSDMAIGKHTDVYEDKSENDSCCKWIKDGVFTGDEILQNLGSSQCFAVVAWAKLYKQELFRDIRYPIIACGEDCCVYPYIMKQCSKVSSVDELVYFYFQRPSSTVHVYGRLNQLGDLEANLRLTQFLFKNDYFSAACKWYGHSIDIACNCEDKLRRLELLERYFIPAEHRMLLQRQKIKKCLKWLTLYYPLVEKIYVFWKNYELRKCDRINF